MGKFDRYAFTVAKQLDHEAFPREIVLDVEGYRGSSPLPTSFSRLSS